MKQLYQLPPRQPLHATWISRHEPREPSQRRSDRIPDVNPLQVVRGPSLPFPLPAESPLHFGLPPLRYPFPNARRALHIHPHPPTLRSGLLVMPREEAPHQWVTATLRIHVGQSLLHPARQRQSMDVRRSWLASHHYLGTA